MKCIRNYYFGILLKIWIWTSKFTYIYLVWFDLAKLWNSTQKKIMRKKIEWMKKKWSHIQHKLMLNFCTSSINLIHIYTTWLICDFLLSFFFFCVFNHQTTTTMLALKQRSIRKKTIENNFIRAHLIWCDYSDQRLNVINLNKLV